MANTKPKQEGKITMRIDDSVTEYTPEELAAILREPEEKESSTKLEWVKGIEMHLVRCEDAFKQAGKLKRSKAPIDNVFQAYCNATNLYDQLIKYINTNRRINSDGSITAGFSIIDFIEAFGPDKLLSVYGGAINCYMNIEGAASIQYRPILKKRREMLEKELERLRSKN